MAEYASLVLKVDSSSAKAAQGDLQGLQAEGGKAESSMANLGKAATVAGTAIAAAAAATVAMVAASVQAADAAGEAAQAAGITTEEFTRLQYAMQFDGAPENLGQSMKFLNNAMVDAAGGSGKAADAFGALGVSVANQDGTLKNSHDVMLQVADKFAGMADGAQKAALATDIFGKAGSDMIPFLNNGAAGIAQLEAEADRLGITINDNTAAAAGHLNDTFGRLKSAGAGMSNQIMVAMMPSLTALGDELVASATNSGAMEMAGQALVVVLKTVLTVVVAVVAAFQAAGQAIYATGKSLALAATGDFKGAYEAMKGGVGDVASTIEGAMARVNTIWTASADNTVAQEQRKVDAIHATAAAAAGAPSAGGAAAPGGLGSGPMPPEGAIAITPLSGMAEATTMQGEEIDALLDEIYPSFLEKQQAYNDATQAIAREEARAKTMTTLGALGDIAGAFAGHSKAMFKAQKVAGIAAGLLSIQTGIANAMALPFPANLAAAATVATQGAGIMANLKSITDTGGGSVKGPSGGKSSSLSMGGSASNASPTPAPAIARQQVTDIRLTGIRPDDMISGSYLQKIIAGIGETLADNGGRMGKVELVMSA